MSREKGAPLTISVGGVRDPPPPEFRSSRKDQKGLAFFTHETTGSTKPYLPSRRNRTISLKQFKCTQTPIVSWLEREKKGSRFGGTRVLLKRTKDFRRERCYPIICSFPPPLFPRIYIIGGWMMRGDCTSNK